MIKLFCLNKILKFVHANFFSQIELPNLVGSFEKQLLLWLAFLFYLVLFIHVPRGFKHSFMFQYIGFSLFLQGFL
jgi:hypothetical protein